MDLPLLLPAVACHRQAVRITQVSCGTRRRQMEQLPASGTQAASCLRIVKQVGRSLGGSPGHAGRKGQATYARSQHVTRAFPKHSPPLAIHPMMTQAAASSQQPHAPLAMVNLALGFQEDVSGRDTSGPTVALPVNLAPTNHQPPPETNGAGRDSRQIEGSYCVVAHHAEYACRLVIMDRAGGRGRWLSWHVGAVMGAPPSCCGRCGAGGCAAGTCVLAGCDGTAWGPCAQVVQVVQAGGPQPPIPANPVVNCCGYRMPPVPASRCSCNRCLADLLRMWW